MVADVYGSKWREWIYFFPIKKKYMEQLAGGAPSRRGRVPQNFDHSLHFVPYTSATMIPAGGALFL